MIDLRCSFSALKHSNSEPDPLAPSVRTLRLLALPLPLPVVRLGKAFTARKARMGTSFSSTSDSPDEKISITSMGGEDTVAGATPETDSATTVVSGADFLLRCAAVTFFGTPTAKSALARVSAERKTRKTRKTRTHEDVKMSKPDAIHCKPHSACRVYQCKLSHSQRILRRDRAWEQTSARHGAKHSVKSREAG
jgi:hypothetical protein